MIEHFKNLWKKNWIWNACAFAIPFLISVIICAVLEIYPFGENCILHIDMYHQYCPFFMEFCDKLAEGESLLYSWNIGLGADFIATYAYYLASPFNWFLFLCPKEYVIEFMTLTTWIKIALCSLFFFWLLVEKFQLKRKDNSYKGYSVIPALVFSLAYAFSGFVAAYSWNIMWMDSVALAPLIVLGLERLVKSKRPALYYASLALSILCNYYISLLICVFLVLYFGLLLLEQKTERIKSCLRFVWYSLLAGGTAAVLLIPEGIALGNTALSNDVFPEKMKWYFGFIEEVSRLCIAVEPYTGTSHWPNLYCGAFTVFLVLLYGLNTRIQWTQKVSRIVLLGLFLLSFSNNMLDFMWHGFHFPNSLPSRQSFLFILMMLLVGYEAYLKRKGNKIWQIVFALFLCICILVAGGFRSDEALIKSVSFWLTGLFITAYALCLILTKIGQKQIRHTVQGFLLGLAIGEIILNIAATGFYSLDRTAYLQKMEDYKILLAIAERDAKMDAESGMRTFYRVEDYERKTKNDDCLYEYPSGTLFSSLTNANISEFYKSVYMESGRNMYCYNGATPLISSMLSVRYMLSDHAEGDNALRSLIGRSGNYYIYENTYSLPLGFMMSESAIENWDISTGEKIKQINDLGVELGVSANMLYPVYAPMTEEAGVTTIKVWEDGFYYANHIKCEADSLSISINDGPKTRYNKTTHKYLLELGECKAGDVITITNTKECTVSLELYQLNLEAVEKAYQALNKQTMVLHEFSDTKIKGQINVQEAGRLIFSIPSDDGWKIFVDGKEVQRLDFKEAFLGIHLEEGAYLIELKYMTPGLISGVIVSGVSVGLFVLSTWIAKRRQSIF